MRGDIHLAVTGSCVQHSPHIANSKRVHGSEIGNDEVLSICENTKSGKDDQTDEPSSATMIEETVLCCNVFFCQGEDQFAMTSNLSVCEVLNNIDVMSDILLWLPPEMIHKLFLVSKRFLEIISDLFSVRLTQTNGNPTFMVEMVTNGVHGEKWMRSLHTKTRVSASRRSPWCCHTSSSPSQSEIDTWLH